MVESASEGERDDRYDDLSSAIKRLDKSQTIKAPSRSIETGPRTRPLPNVLRALEQTGGHAALGGALRKLGSESATLSRPLERHEEAKIKRSTGFEEVKAKLDKWNAVVAQNRAAEHREFPLKDLEERTPAPFDAYVDKFTIKSGLETELEALDRDADPGSTPKNNFPLTMAEMIEHRKELVKLRVKQSYCEAKARRQNKIKSKKFHRIQRKENLKAQTMEKTRAEERATLRHKSNGQWARKQLVRAKYDKETRQQLAEQLAISRELTEKIYTDAASESEEQEEEETGLVAESDSFNPWMRPTADRQAKRKKQNKKKEESELSKLSFKKKKIKPVIDEALDENVGSEGSRINKLTSIVEKNPSSSDKIPIIDKIDPTKFVAHKPKHLLSALPDIDIGDEYMDDEAVKANKLMTIAEAFEDDDIVADFNKEKQGEIDKNKPQIDDSFMPGWGSWTGKNMPVKRRKRRFLKAPKVIPRKDDNKPTLIVNEELNKKIKAHLVSNLPFPFNSVKDFEATIRAPLGKTFIPETAHRKLTQPAVTVKTGIIIKPMDESQLLKPVKIKSNQF